VASQHIDYAIAEFHRIIRDPEHAAAIAETAISKLRGRTCPGCGVHYIARHGNQRYHVPACGFLHRQKLYYSRLISRQEAALGAAVVDARARIREIPVKPD
jgi:hypothetical protein